MVLYKASHIDSTFIITSYHLLQMIVKMLRRHASSFVSNE